MGRSYGSLHAYKANTVYPAWLVAQDVDPDDEFASVRYIAEDPDSGLFWSVALATAMEFNSQQEAEAFIATYKFGQEDQ